MKIIKCADAIKIAQNEMEKMFIKVPFARDFHLGIKTNLEYYKRHLMETVLRIRLNNEVDAYCLYKISKGNTRLAQLLAQYLAEELGHENFFINDLKTFGIDLETLNNTKPFFSTNKLIGYLYHAIDQDGGIPTMVWNWFVEWYSDNYNKKITEKIAKEYGEKYSFGFTKHIEFDEDHDHVSLMFSTVELSVSKPEDMKKVEMYLSQFIELIGEYFNELYEVTMVNEKVVA